MPYPPRSEQRRRVNRNGQRRRRQADLARQLGAGERVERCQLCGELVAWGRMAYHEGKRHYDSGQIWFVYIRGDYHFDVNHNGRFTITKDGEVQGVQKSKAGTVAGIVRMCKRWLLAHAYEQLALDLEDQVVMNDGPPTHA